MLSSDEKRIILEFEALENWEDRYEYIIYLGKKLKIPFESIKNDKYLISGCVSRVWIKSEVVEGRVQYTMQSDSSIIQGVLYLLYTSYNNISLDEVKAKEIEILKILKIDELLSINRRVGVEALIERVKNYNQYN